VTLSKVSKKGREWKEGVIENVREAAEKYPTAYVFRYKDMKNNTFKQIREKLRDSSRFFLGSNKVLQVSLGREPSDEVRENIHNLVPFLKGHVGLMFTELTEEQVKRELCSIREPEFAKSGHAATKTISFSEGPLEGPSGRLEHTLEPTLRKHGMPTRLNKGVVDLVTDFTLCTKGEALSPAQAALLRVFGVKMAVFRMKLVCKWHDGDFQTLAKDEDTDEEEDSEEEDVAFR